MTEKPSATPGRLLLAVIGVVLVVAGIAAGWLWQRADPAAALSSGDRAAIEKVVHDYILEHPEVLPSAMANLQRRESAKQLAGIRDEVEKPFPGAILGNPKGSVTLVEFTDFGCTYCKQSVADVEALIAENPELRIVVRELPILSPESADAARMALAAAEQGKYAAFHKAMFAAGRPGPETIEAAARAAGLDLARAKAAMGEKRIEAEIIRNVDMARQLGFNGTPSWVAGDELLSGAIGKDRLAEAIARIAG